MAVVTGTLLVIMSSMMVLAMDAQPSCETDVMA